MQQPKRLAAHDCVLSGFGGGKRRFRQQNEKGVQGRLCRLGLGQRTPSQLNRRDILRGDAPAQLRGRHRIELSGH